MNTILQLIGLYLLADFITGIIHWLEDCYGNPNWKYLGEHVVIPNIEHHIKPRKMLEGSFFERIKISFAIAIAIAIAFGFSWQIVFFALVVSLANEFHAVLHRTDKENGKIICFIQKIGLIQSKRTHGLHHKSPYNINYCVITDYLNPVLTYIRFFGRIEKCLSMFGIHPLRGTKVRNFK